ncbi:hypothetical protein K7432_010918 [Basidiobolus ranarum]|uniref:Uncharacterized protein n=1 Tax=Basidiobolus ranarum TaxID=34480 RepID=A0ABR2VV58_9FUNG
MYPFNIFNKSETRKSIKQQKSSIRNSSDYAPIPTFDTHSLNTNSTLSLDSAVTVSAEVFDELECILERTIRTRYTKQDVHLSPVQEYDLELAKLAGLLERGEKRRLESQDCNSTLISKIKL